MRGVAAISVLVSVIASAHATSPAPACTDVTVKAHGWAELKRYPPKPSHAKSLEWAKAQEEARAAYYLSEYCPDGKIQSLTKRVGRKVMFRYDFDYMGDKLFGVRETDENGNVHLHSGK
jgi:hypothetical protein